MLPGWLHLVRGPRTVPWCNHAIRRPCTCSFLAVHLLVLNRFASNSDSTKACSGHIIRSMAQFRGFCLPEPADLQLVR